MIKFYGISYRTNQLVSGDLIQKQTDLIKIQALRKSALDAYAVAIEDLIQKEQKYGS